MEILFGREDFKHMVAMRTDWNDELALQPGRWEFQDSTSGSGLITGWTYAYWVTDRWLDAVFMRAWLDREGMQCDILWDTEVRQYVILTNYEA